MTPDTVAALTAALRDRDQPMYEGTPIGLRIQLSLRPGQWGPRPGQTATWYTDIRIERVYRARGADGYVALGHVPLCDCDPGGDQVCHLVWLTAPALTSAEVRIVATPEADR